MLIIAPVTGSVLTHNLVCCARAVIIAGAGLDPNRASELGLEFMRDYLFPFPCSVTRLEGDVLDLPVVLLGLLLAFIV